eukprot:4484767-Pleurochrysis_carterae.AAC.1
MRNRHLKSKCTANARTLKCLSARQQFITCCACALDCATRTAAGALKRSELAPVTAKNSMSAGPLRSAGAARWRPCESVAMAMARERVATVR